MVTKHFTEYVVGLACGKTEYLPFLPKYFENIVYFREEIRQVKKIIVGFGCNFNQRRKSNNSFLSWPKLLKKYFRKERFQRE